MSNSFCAFLGIQFVLANGDVSRLMFRYKNHVFERNTQ